jgi:hypothetical protein
LEISELEKIKYRKKRNDPLKKIIQRHLDSIMAASGLKEEEIIENLKKYGMVYSRKNNGLHKILDRSAPNLRTFIKLMLASNLSSYKIDITEDERKEIEKHEEKNR